MATEKFVQHRIINCNKLNIRESASINSKVICTLNAGQTVQVVAESAKTVSETNKATGNKVKITWLKIKSNDNRYWLSAAYVEAIPSSAAATVYDTVIECKCQHKSGATTLAQIISKAITTCATSVSVYLQLINCLDPGVIVSHTNAVSSNILAAKDTVGKAMTNSGKLKNCKIVRIGKKYADMPSAYKKAGIVYVQDSNTCVCAGAGYIYSTNNAQAQLTDGRYTTDKVKSGYPFNSYILYAIVPDIIG